VLKGLLLQHDCKFVSLREGQESTAAALTAELVRLSRVETQFRYAPPAPVSPPKAAATAALPSPTQTAAARDPARNLNPPLDSTIISDFPEVFAQFCEKLFSLMCRGGRTNFESVIFTATATAT
jgi:hypothetical protein